MADYYPLLAKAVAGLPDATAEARHAVYERARKALFGQLRNLDPPVPEEVIEREAQALERAVAQLETDLAGPPAEAAPVPANELAPAPPRPVSPEPEPAPPAKPAAPAARAARPPPPLKIRRDADEASPAAKLAGTPPTAPAGKPAAVPPAAKAPATPGEPNVAADSMASMGQSASSAPDFSCLAAPMPGPEDSISNGPSFESFAPEMPPAGRENNDPPARTRLEALRPFAPHPEEDAGAARRIGIVAAIVGVLVVLVAIAAFKLRDRPEDLLRLQPASPAIPGEAGPGGKIVDRIAAGTATPGSPAAPVSGPAAKTAMANDAGKTTPGPANPVLPVARLAALVMEAPDQPSRMKTIVGKVIWRVNNVSNGPDEPLSTSVRAEIDIPDARVEATMTIQKNFDSTLPASHIIKLNFATRPDSPLANIKQVSVQLRREENQTGEALKGITVPVTENSFLIGLSRGDGEASNLNLLRNLEWFDIAMVLADGHIAKLTFEKGPAGRSALADAMASWQAQ